MKKPKKQPTPRVYDDQQHPRYFPEEQWMNSPLSITRFYGSCKYNNVDYEIDYLTGDLCREDVMKARRQAYTPQDLATIKAKYAGEDDSAVSA